MWEPSYEKSFVRSYTTFKLLSLLSTRSGFLISPSFSFLGVLLVTFSEDVPGTRAESMPVRESLFCSL